jgi:2-amino-4-hydroxy-6-hydroxymethyldihydropteridine diphosphokinase
MAIVYLGLGSNLGDRGANLQKALMELEKWEVKIVRASSLYETEPVDFHDQPWFLNMVVLAETKLDVEELLEAIHLIEKILLREQVVRFGPRTIDIDILFYLEQGMNESVVVDIPDLQIPHPRLHERQFVLKPMVEIAPDFTHPVLKKTVSDLLKECKDKSIVRLLS